MTKRDLHLISERLLREWNLLTSDGEMRERTIDIDHIAEQHLNITIVGSESRGLYRLPARKLGAINIAERKIIVRRRLLEDDKHFRDYRHVISHETAHAILHSELVSQMFLPFENHEVFNGHSNRLAFSRDGSAEFEVEANVLGALLLIPFRELIKTLAQIINTYSSEATPISNSLVEERAAAAYYRGVVPMLMQRFEVSKAVALMVLHYWNAHMRPPLEWQRLAREVRNRTSK